MSRLFYHVMQDNVGNLLFDVSGTMRIAGSGTLATIYGDEGLTIPIANPMTNHPSFGSFKCFLGAGDYDFYMAKSGYTFETLTGVQGHGTMAQQDAGAVAITGGSATLDALAVTAGATVDSPTLVVQSATHCVGVGTASPATKLDVFGDLTVSGRMAIGNTLAFNPSAHLKIDFTRGTFHGITIRPSDSDTVGGASPVLFNNTGSVPVGSIGTTATATNYNTTSDSRLKKLVETLTGELEAIQALRPVSFRWNSDDSPGVGFLASEVAAHVQGVITGEADAVDEAGGIVPQMIDYSKLVPYLVGALKTLAARVAVLEDALGV